MSTATPAETPTMGRTGPAPRPSERPSATAHLTPANLASAQRSLVAKAIAEFAHERILQPVRDGDDYVVESPDHRVRYRFRGRVLALEHWLIDRESLSRERDGEPRDLDAQELMVEFADVLGIPPALLPTYLEEIGSTLAATAWKLEHHGTSAAELVDADYQDVEAAMTEGHPGFVANNGRIGFGIDDYSRWAPESGRKVRLVWLAARRSSSALSCGEGIDETSLYEDELDDSVREYFTERLVERGLDPAAYLWLPLHPWQWTNKVAITFAPDLARDDLVYLGRGRTPTGHSSRSARSSTSPGPTGTT